MKNLILILSSVLGVFGDGRSGFGPANQDWGYITVREKAHMFWWLYYTTATQNFVERPLVIWLQGGPGGSSTGIGNFHEIGPIDVRQHERNGSWVQFVNVLFVDNPVGTGFSYIEGGFPELFATNNSEIAQDFLVFLKGFLEKVSQFRSVPIYIFGQSYGGKMAADIALLLYQESKTGNINCNLKGIGLGDAWISPVDSLTSWPSYLLNLGFIDPDGHDFISIVTNYAKEQMDAGIYENATRYFIATQTLINRLVTIDYYNILNKMSSTGNYLKTAKKKSFYLPNSEEDDDILNELMNGLVKDTLNLTNSTPVRWGEQSDLVFDAVNLDFMKPVTDVVERILNETDLSVSVYNGQLDLIVDTPGTIAWVNKLKWNEVEKWKEATRTEFVIGEVYEGYEKRYGNLNVYWVNRAGHAVPSDNPAAMEYILRQVTENFVV